MTFTAASLRNRGPILDILRQLPLPSIENAGHALEIAGGAGAHLAINAPAFPDLIWHPTDLNPSEFDRSLLSHSNVSDPVALDVSTPVDQWPLSVTKHQGQYALMLCVNMVHISPWEATQGMMAGAQALLGDNGALVIYGPFFETNVPTVPSNVFFDESLRNTDPRWGIRTLESVESLATRYGLRLCSRFEMPANNLFVVFSRNSCNLSDEENVNL